MWENHLGLHWGRSGKMCASSTVYWKKYSVLGLLWHCKDWTHSTQSWSCLVVNATKYSILIESAFRKSSCSGNDSPWMHKQMTSVYVNLQDWVCGRSFSYRLKGVSVSTEPWGRLMGTHRFIRSNQKPISMDIASVLTDVWVVVIYHLYMQMYGVGDRGVCLSVNKIIRYCKSHITYTNGWTFLSWNFKNKILETVPTSWELPALAV